MRTDAVGLFWEDVQRVARGATRVRGPMPNIPETGWRPPKEFPNLSAAKVIGVDTETYDPTLMTAGPGWSRNSGHIVGVSISVQDGSAWYFPVRHETQTEYNLEPTNTFAYLRELLKDNRPKVGANMIYDIGWLSDENITVGGRIYDIQFAEALLNSEEPDVSLDNLAMRYLGIGKHSDLLYDWLSKWLGGPATDKQRANIYLAPPSIVGPYAEADASQPIAILSAQWPKLHTRGALDLFDMECRLIPLLVKMRRKGAPVDIARSEQLYDELTIDLSLVEQQISALVGRPVNPGARDSLLSAFQQLGIPIPVKADTKTKQQKVSFDAERLRDVDHPLAALLLNHRQITKVRDTFIKSYILDKNVNGRLHCSFHPLRNDSSGTRSGRFSSSDPNLQNIPTRSDLGRRVRQCFASPHGKWRKIDHSQIEYRMLAHHAVGDGAEALRDDYRKNPDTDYHERTQKLVKAMTSLDVGRPRIKNVNFGLIYGMTIPRLALTLGLSIAEVKKLFESYHTAAPYVQATMTDSEQFMHRHGYIDTVLGRRSDFNKWTNAGFSTDREELDFKAAADKWGVYNIKRSRAHAALNRRLQGGAADVMKAGMVEAYEAGLFEDTACGIPLLTVHDELDFEDGGDENAPYWAELCRVLETAVPVVRIPLKVEMTVGASWGDAK